LFLKIGAAIGTNLAQFLMLIRSAALRRRFTDRCQFWISEMAEWEKKAKANGPATYMCTDQSQCHGLGDRLGGVVGAFNFAMHQHRPFRMAWHGASRCPYPPLPILSIIHFYLNIKMKLTKRRRHVQNLFTVSAYNASGRLGPC